MKTALRLSAVARSCRARAAQCTAAVLVALCGALLLAAPIRAQQVELTPEDLEQIDPDVKRGASFLTSLLGFSPAVQTSPLSRGQTFGILTDDIGFPLLDPIDSDTPGSIAIIQQRGITAADVGTGNEATIDQIGADNVAVLSQEGSRNETALLQRGARNIFGARLQGNDNRLAVAQIGNDNSYVLDYEGDDLNIGSFLAPSIGLDSGVPLLALQEGDRNQVVQTGTSEQRPPFPVVQYGSDMALIIRHNQ